MPVDPAIPITRDVKELTANNDLDPDGVEDLDAQEANRKNRPEDWNEPPAAASVPSADVPSPRSDDQR